MSEIITRRSLLAGAGAGAGLLLSGCDNVIHNPGVLKYIYSLTH